MKHEVDLDRLPGLVDWLALKWTAMNPETALIGRNDLGLWTNDKKGSTHLIPWKDVLVSVLMKLVREGAPTKRRSRRSGRRHAG